MARDYYNRVVADDDNTSPHDEEKKYSKLKTPKRIIFLLGCLCAMSLLALFRLQGHPVSNEKLGRRTAGASSASAFPRILRDDARRCRKSVTSMRVELESRGLSNSATDCNVPTWASLLGFLQLKGHGEGLRIGLVNFDDEEEQNLREFALGWANYYVFPFERSQLQWSELFPEWIDEEASPPEKCPNLPMPSVGNRGGGGDPVLLHAVVIKVPSCSRRDVLRLQALLAGANVASDAGGNAESMWVLVISACRPYLNLFPCHELLEQQDDLWLFQVSLQRIRQLLAIPVGTCELALLPESKAGVPSLKGRTQVRDVQHGFHVKLTEKRPRREAYATVLHTNEAYICGAIVTAQSIRASGSQKDLIALVSENMTPEIREGLRQAGWQLQDIERIRNPKSEPEAYNEWNYSKFRLWQLTRYDKIVFIDADLLVLRNLDFLFDVPEISATGNDGSLFNSGVMVIEPSNCTFTYLMDNINDIESYNGGDQGYLNEIFPWWHRVPKSVNFLKHFWTNGTKERDEKTRLFEARDPPSLHVIHYLGKKPWLCYRDYDCNWNRADHHQYANDVANERWWDVHDSMTVRLQKHCLLKTETKAAMEYHRRVAEAAAYEDEHWKINVTDPRIHVCIDSFCDWKSMLKHWKG